MAPAASSGNFPASYAIPITARRWSLLQKFEKKVKKMNFLGFDCPTIHKGDHMG